MAEYGSDYMVVVNDHGELFKKFFYEREDADQYKMDAECGLGACAAVYWWSNTECEYIFWYE